ncbi:hypothetical protein JZU68_05580 [bacterium]|jgi:hypothetical protein|nr:hypothetical protein [bacterium]
MGPFQLRISSHAEQLDFSQLDEERKAILLNGIEFDESKFAIYRFFVFPEFLPGKPKTKRWRDRKSYERASHAIIIVKSGNSQIRFRGHFPQTLMNDNGHSVERVGGVTFLLGFLKVFQLKLEGRIKDAVRTGKSVIIASRTDEIAQWIFSKPRIHNDPNFQMEILCAVPNDLSPEDRFIRCKAKISDNGRELDKKSKNILLM